MIFLKESTFREQGSLNISKLLKINILLEASELEDLLNALEKESADIYFFRVQGIYPSGEAYLSKKEILNKYATFISELKQGIISKNYQEDFALFATKDLDALYSIKLDRDREMIRANKPVITIQLGKIQFSSEDEQFRSQIFSEDAICWGLYFSYPQLFQDPFSKEVLSTKDNQEYFPNSAVFKKLQLWVRHNSIPTPFFVNGKRINSPIRIGKRCLKWINSHPQLISKKIQVETCG